jgi:hypothetical protein
MCDALEKADLVSASAAASAAAAALRAILHPKTPAAVAIREYALVAYEIAHKYEHLWMGMNDAATLGSLSRLSSILRMLLEYCVRNEAEIVLFKHAETMLTCMTVLASVTLDVSVKFRSADADLNRFANSLSTAIRCVPRGGNDLSGLWPAGMAEKLTLLALQTQALTQEAL